MGDEKSAQLAIILPLNGFFKNWTIYIIFGGHVLY